MKSGILNLKSLLAALAAVARGRRRSGLLLAAYCLLAALLLWRSGLPTPALRAQQPQAQSGQPIFSVNAKYVNGVAFGYWPTAGTGLTLNLSAGTIMCSFTAVNYAGGTLTMAASATNRVYLDYSNSCAPASNTATGFNFGQLPIANVVTNATAITSITDLRLAPPLTAAVYDSFQNVYLGPATGKVVYLSDPAIDADTSLSRLQAGIIRAGNSLAPKLSSVTFSATPTFDASLGNTQAITLTGNVTSSTLSNCVSGQWLVFDIIEDATGGRTFVFPTTVKGAGALNTAASKHNVQMFYCDGTNAWATSPMQSN